MAIRVKMIKTLDTYEGGYEYAIQHGPLKTFENYKDLLNYMKQTYNQWVIEFNPKGRELSSEPFDFVVELYDHYRE